MLFRDHVQRKRAIDITWFKINPMHTFVAPCFLMHSDGGFQHKVKYSLEIILSLIMSLTASKTFLFVYLCVELLSVLR